MNISTQLCGIYTPTVWIQISLHILPSLTIKWAKTISVRVNQMKISRILEMFDDAV